MAKYSARPFALEGPAAADRSDHEEGLPRIIGGTTGRRRVGPGTGPADADSCRPGNAAGHHTPADDGERGSFFCTRSSASRPTALESEHQTGFRMALSRASARMVQRTVSRSGRFLVERRLFVVGYKGRPPAAS